MRPGRRVTLAFAAGVVGTLLVLTVVAVIVVIDQRRTARVAAATLSRVLGREVEIARVPRISPGQVVLEGLRLPATGGWPAEIRVRSVEATGSLVAAATGERGPVTVVVRQPTVTLGAGGGGGAGGTGLTGLGDALAALLAPDAIIDVSVIGGSLEHGQARAEFDLTLKKDAQATRAELVVRGEKGPPLTVTALGRLDGGAARVEMLGTGSLAPLGPWLAPAGAARLAEPPLDLALVLILPRAPAGAPAPASPALEGRGRLTLGDLATLEAEGTQKDGVLSLTLGRVALDLGFAASAVGLPWRPVGRAEVSGGRLTWRPEGGGLPAASGVVRVPTLALPAGAVGAGAVDVAGVEARLDLASPVLRLEARADRIKTGSLEAAALVRGRLALSPAARPTRVDLDEWQARVPGGTLSGTAAYDLERGRLTGRGTAADLDAGALLRAFGQTWLAAGDRLRVQGLTLTLTDLDPVGQRAGQVAARARALTAERSDGRAATGPVAAEATLASDGVPFTLDVQQLSGSLPWFRGALAALGASGRLARQPNGTLVLGEATLTGRISGGQEALRATVRPGEPGALRAMVSVPALERLDGLWPDVTRKLRGEAELAVQARGPGYQEIDGRLKITVPEAEAAGGHVLVRDVVADLPIRRGPGPAAQAPWGRIELSEVLAYGLLVRDVQAAARLAGDRLDLERLAYTLYDGQGGGTVGVDLAAANGPQVLAHLTGERVRIEQLMSSSGVRGGTMTGLMRYDLQARSAGSAMAMDGWLDVPAGGAVNIELLNRLLSYAGSDPTGVVKSALENLRNFEYKDARVDIRTPADGDPRLTLGLRGRERFGIFPPRVKEINVRSLPLSFLTRQLAGR